MYYECFGEGRPIIFLPGWGGDNGEGRDIHEPVFEHRAGWQRIYVDPPGTGMSPAVPSIKDQDGMLAAIVELVDELVGDKRFALAGTSAGALHFRGRIQADVNTYSLSENPAARFDGPTLIVTGRQDTITGYADAWSVLDPR